MTKQSRQVRIKSGIDFLGGFLAAMEYAGMNSDFRQTGEKHGHYTEDYLSELYEKGSTSDKKHRFQPNVVRGYQKGINYLKVVNKIEDLFPIKSLNYEVLTGDKKGISSIRANDKYRIEFIVDKENEMITVCNILELSNHYK